MSSAQVSGSSTSSLNNLISASPSCFMVKAGSWILPEPPEPSLMVSFLYHTPFRGASRSGTFVLLAPHCHSGSLFLPLCPNYSAFKCVQLETTCDPCPLQFPIDLFHSLKPSSCSLSSILPLPYLYFFKYPIFNSPPLVIALDCI